MEPRLDLVDEFVGFFRVVLPVDSIWFGAMVLPFQTPLTISELEALLPELLSEDRFTWLKLTRKIATTSPNKDTGLTKRRICDCRLWLLLGFGLEIANACGCGI